MKRARRKPKGVFAAALYTCASLALFSASAAKAEISFVDMFRANSFTQTANGNSLSSNGSFLSLSLTSVGPNDYTAAQVTYPGPGSPRALLPDTPMLFKYQSASYPTQAAMDADFPMGIYTFAAARPGGPDTTNFTYSADAYALTQPYLAGATFSNLQGANPTTSIPIQFSAFTPAAGINESFLFFTIFDTATNTFVFDAGFQPATTTSLSVPANTLQANHGYLYEVIFSDRVTAPSPGSNFPAQIGFDLRTTGSFTTGVPEPATFVLAGVGIGIGLLIARIGTGIGPKYANSRSTWPVKNRVF